MSGDEGRWIEAWRGAARLRLRIEQTRADTGHPLHCSECGRISRGRATGWTMHLGDGGHLYAFCPECNELEFG
jgi:hypothetical protein